MKYKLKFVGGRNCITRLGGELNWSKYEMKEVSKEFFDHFKNNTDFVIVEGKNEEEKKDIFGLDEKKVKKKEK